MFLVVVTLAYALAVSGEGLKSIHEMYSYTAYFRRCVYIQCTYHFGSGEELSMVSTSRFF